MITCENLPGNPSIRPGAQLRTPAPNRPLNDARIHALQQALGGKRPRLLDGDPQVSRAAVALILRPTIDDLEILLIERPHSPEDPWSGHMAFPGGRQEGGEDHVETAMREAHEEVGLDLASYGTLIGRLDDIRPARGGPQIAVAAFVFAVPSTASVDPDPAEVASALWIPLGHLVDPACAAEHLHPLPDGGRMHFPAVTYHGHVIWGLTYRMLMQFLEIARTTALGHPS